MVEKQESKSEARHQSKSRGFKFPCCSSENMPQMMQKFCGGEHGSFDYCSMLEKMCGTDQEKSD